MPEAEDVLPLLGVAGVTVVLPELPGVLVVPPPGSSPWIPERTVSYTHLDVYKRQGA